MGWWMIPTIRHKSVVDLYNDDSCILMVITWIILIVSLPLTYLTDFFTTYVKIIGYNSQLWYVFNSTRRFNTMKRTAEPLLFTVDREWAISNNNCSFSVYAVHHWDKKGKITNPISYDPNVIVRWSFTQRKLRSKTGFSFYSIRAKFTISL